MGDELGKTRADRAETDALFATLYRELHRLAAGQLRGEAAHATSLVHEAWEKFARHDGDLVVADREHFFAIAARAMRQIVVDHVRNRGAQRRGGGQIAPIETTALEVAAEGRDDDVLALDDALVRLGETDPALAELVELRFYGGLGLEEIAALRDRSERSLKRDWRRARAFLYRELADDDAD